MRDLTARYRQLDLLLREDMPQDVMHGTLRCSLHLHRVAHCVLLFCRTDDMMQSGDVQMDIAMDEGDEAATLDYELMRAEAAEAGQQSVVGDVGVGVGAATSPPLFGGSVMARGLLGAARAVRFAAPPPLTCIAAPAHDTEASRNSHGASDKGSGTSNRMNMMQIVSVARAFGKARMQLKAMAAKGDSDGDGDATNNDEATGDGRPKRRAWGKVVAAAVHAARAEAEPPQEEEETEVADPDVDATTGASVDPIQGTPRATATASASQPIVRCKLCGV